MNYHLLNRLTALHLDGMSLDDRVRIMRKSYICDVSTVSDFFFQQARGYYPNEGPGFTTCAQRLSAENHANGRYIFIRRECGEGFHVVERTWDVSIKRQFPYERRRNNLTETRV